MITTTSMPAIDVGALFIWQYDGISVTTEDDDDADTDAGENARDYLEVALNQFWEGLFRRRTTSEKTMETSRDDEHEEDAVPRSRFETLCEGGASGDASWPSSTRLAPRGCRRRHRRPTARLRGTWRGRRKRRNGGYIYVNNNNDCIQRRDVRNRITI